ILKRVPKFLLPYAQRFAHAPYCHVITFVILHELSAIVPLMGLWYLFNRFDYVPVNFAPVWAIEHGVDMLKGYVDIENGIFKYWAVVDKGKLIVQGANAYAITKMLMPLRVMLSVALTPVVSRWFVEPWGKIF
ncbi:hypothetical protein BABINDRAFT_27090, partial [Babjeviella inositovora NRRL Y-12698]